MYIGKGAMKKAIWASGGFMSEAGYLCQAGDEVFDSPFAHCPITIEPPAGRAFCCTAADVTITESAEVVA